METQEHFSWRKPHWIDLSRILWRCVWDCSFKYLGIVPSKKIIIKCSQKYQQLIQNIFKKSSEETTLKKNPPHFITCYEEQTAHTTITNVLYYCHRRRIVFRNCFTFQNDCATCWTNPNVLFSFCVRRVDWKSPLLAFFIIDFTTFMFQPSCKEV